MLRNTDVTYRNATLADGQKEKLIGDGDNLYLRVRESNKRGLNKTWVFVYLDPITKSRKKLTIGSYPIVSLKEARNHAFKYAQQLIQGIDPAETIKITGKELFRDVAEEWFKDSILQEEQKKIDAKIILANERAKGLGLDKASNQEIKAITRDIRYAKDIRGRLDNHILPALGKYPVVSITPYLAKNAFDPVYATGINMDKICQITNRIMRRARVLDIIKYNPIADLGELFVNKKTISHPTVKPEKIGSILIEIGEKNLTKPVRATLEMQIHTLTRSLEIAMLRWDEIDKTKNQIVIPAYRMKRGKDHIIPLTKYTNGILEYMKPISGHQEYVFQSDPRSKRPHVNPQTVNACLKRTGYTDELVAHGFRSVGSTLLNDASAYGSHERFARDLVEMCLAHIDDDKMRDIYNNAENIEERRRILSFWGNYLVEQTSNRYSIAGRFK